MAKLLIKWIRSDIGHPRDQKMTIKALGFHKLNETIEKEDKPSVRGMITKVNHLVHVEERENESK